MGSTALLGARKPIWQAPVGSMAGPELAIAVARGGGVGALALTWTSPERTRELIGALEGVPGVYQGNFVLAFQPVSLSAALESGLRLVSFSWGQPTSYVSLVRSFGAKFGVQTTSRDGARRALDIGADFLIVQGVEAGGHVQATRSLWEILPEVISEAGQVPVVAAGGIGSGKGIARALTAGASGAMLGTRFVATHESVAHETYKRLIVDARSRDTVLTVCFDGGWPYAPQRVLRNSTLAAWEAAGCPPPGRRPGEGDRLAWRADGTHVLRYEDVPPHVAMSGTVEALSLYAGTSCDEITDIANAAHLVERLSQECAAELRQQDPTRGGNEA